MSMRSKHTLMTHLGIWLLVPTLELYLSFSHPHRHEVWQYALEFLVFGALATAQWRFAGGHWMGSLLCAGLVPVFVAVVARVPGDRLTQLFYTAGVLLLSTAVLKDIGGWGEDRGRGRAAVCLGVVVALVGTLGSFALDLQRQLQDVGGRLGNEPTSFWQQYAEQVFWPLGTRNAASAPNELPPIILVTVDTLRADDALGMESHRWLAERGRWWPSVMSTSSWTLPAVASIQTGLLPGDHGATCLYDAHCQGLAEQAPTIAEELAARGYRTVALTTNPWISDPASVARGYQQILDYASLAPFRLTFLQRPAGADRQDASVLVDATLSWLQAGPRSGYLLWLHLIDPHMPYMQTPDLAGVTVQALRTGSSASEETRSRIRAAYRKEVDHLDGELMRLIDWLDGDGFFDRGVLILTSDHGEEFWEHGGIEHGHSHHSEVIEVPLAMAGVGVMPGADSGVASLVDIAPTMRAISGSSPVDRDLRAGSSPDRILRAQGVLVGPLIRSARDASARVIVRGDERFEPLVVQRYDRLADPDERDPSSPSSEDPVARAALDTAEPAVGDVLPVNQEALRALGYVE